MRSFETFTFVTTFLSCFLTIISISTLVAAQNQSESSTNANVTAPHKLGVKITSPLKNATVPAGQLTISGISSNHLGSSLIFSHRSHCQPCHNVSS